MTVPTHAITGASGQPGRLAVQELLARSVPVSDVVGFADDAGEVHPSHRCLNDFGAGHARRRTGEETKVPRPIDEPPRRGVTICGTSRWEILRCKRQVRPASENDERVGTPPDRRWDSGSGSNGKLAAELTGSAGAPAAGVRESTAGLHTGRILTALEAALTRHLLGDTEPPQTGTFSATLGHSIGTLPGTGGFASSRAVASASALLGSPWGSDRSVPLLGGARAGEDPTPALDTSGADDQQR